jgi:hypothetical protein
MVTITISGTDYDSYLSVADADDFLGADLALYATWAAATTDDKGRALVSATRWIDQQSWQGSKTSDAQPLDWPRTGVIFEGESVDSGSVPQDILDGCAMLAALLIQDSSIAGSSSTSSNIKRVLAGTAEVEFFTPTKGGSFPDKADRYFRGYLSGYASLTYNFGSLAFGTKDSDGNTIASDIPIQSSFIRNSGLA